MPGYSTDQYHGVIAEIVTVAGHNDEPIDAYFARPDGAGPFPGVVLVHHAPGWDEFYRETAWRFADRGYAAICPNLYQRAGHGEPTAVAARVRESGGVPDDQVVGDLAAAAEYLRAQPSANGKVGVLGSCSGGRHAFLAAARTKDFDAVVDCWGGRVVASPEDLTPNQPVAALDYTADLSVPLLGLFGEEDRSPTEEQVAIHEAELKRLGKDYEFHNYAGAGHGFFYWQSPAYRQEQAMDAWRNIWGFFGKHLANA